MCIKKLVGLCLIFLVLTVQAEPVPKVVPIQTWNTSNGARVLFVAAPEIPMIQINTVFAAGSARDQQAYGLAQLTNSMLDQGTSQHNADQIAAAFDDIGAIYGANVDRDMAVVSLQSLTDPKYFNSALQNYIEVISKPNFPQTALERLQKQTLVALNQQLQAPDVVSGKAFVSTLYGNQPYGHPVLGTPETVTKITTADLQRFYQQYYVAKNALITIVGAVNKQQAMDIAQQITAALPTGEKAPAIPMATAAAKGGVQKINFPSEQTHILMGGMGITYQDPQYFPLLVGNYIFGGAPLSSQLFLQVREKRGLVYNISSGFRPLAAKGPYAIILQTRNNEAATALQVVQDTLKQFLSKGPSSQELVAAQKKIINGFPLGIANNDAISSNLVTIGFYNLPLNYLDTYRDNIRAVTTNQIKQAFAERIHPEQLITVMVGKTVK